HLQHLVIGIDHFSVIKGYDVGDVLADSNWKRESAVQTDARGDWSTWEIRVMDNVVDPRCLATGQDAADQIDARKQDGLAAVLFELFHFVGRDVPAAFNM